MKKEKLKIGSVKSENGIDMVLIRYDGDREVWVTKKYFLRKKRSK